MTARRSTPAALGALLGLLGLWALALAHRLPRLEDANLGSDGMGQWLSAYAVFQGGQPTPPNPEGGHSLWVGGLLPVALARSLRELVALRLAMGALIAPLTAAAAARAGAGGGAAALAGVIVAVDPGLIDTLVSAFRGYGAPELGALVALGVAAGQAGRAWGPAVAVGAAVGAAGQHPLGVGLLIGVVAAAPGLGAAAGARALGAAAILGAGLIAARLRWLAQLAACGRGALTCLGEVAQGSAEPELGRGAMLLRALHDRFEVDPGVGWWAPLLAGALLVAVAPGARRARGPLLTFTVACTLGILAVGLGVMSLRPYHLRVAAAPLAVLAALGVGRVAGSLGAGIIAGALMAVAGIPDWAHVRLGSPGWTDGLAAQLAARPGPMRVDAVWFDSPVGVEPAPLVLAAVLAGAPAARFRADDQAEALLIVNGTGAGWPAGGEPLLAWPAGGLLRFPDAAAARAWIDAAPAPPVARGGAFDWARALHPGEVGAVTAL